MTKTLTHIEVPKEWESTNDWDSHRELIYLCLTKLDPTAIIEMGAGFGSTPLIWEYCKKEEVFFVSLDNDREWCEEIKYTAYIGDYSSYPHSSMFDMLFVDGKPGEERKDLIKLWSNEAKIIIAHDTEKGAEYVYGMAKTLSTFKYRLDYQPEGKPHTTAVSNFIDVTKWS